MMLVMQSDIIFNRIKRNVKKVKYVINHRTMEAYLVPKQDIYYNG